MLHHAGKTLLVTLVIACFAVSADAQTSKTAFRSIAGAPFNVLDYGAKGDGVENDTAAIQAAIDAAEAVGTGGFFGSGATVYFSPGIYVITATLTVNQHGVRLVGAGINNTMILNKGTNIDTIKVAHAMATPTSAPLINGVVIRDMILDYAGRDPTAGAHIMLDRANTTTIKNMQIMNHYVGVELAGTGKSTKIIDSDIETLVGRTTGLQAGSAGIRIRRRRNSSSSVTAVKDPADSLWYEEPNSVYLDNLNIRSFGFGHEYGIDIDAVDGLYFTNSHVNGSVTACIRIRASQSSIPLVNVQVSNVFIDPRPGTSRFGILYEDNPALSSTYVFQHNWTNIIVGGADAHGIVIRENVRLVNFSGGLIKRSGQSGIVLRDGSHVTISSFAFNNNNRAGGEFPDIRIAGATDVIVANNTFTGRSWRGVQTSGAITDRVIVTNNLFKGLGDRGPHSSIFLGSTRDNDWVSGNKSDKPDRVASAATISVPLEHDVVEVTGTTDIDSIDATAAGGRSSFEGRLLTLIFTGVLTVNDGTGNIELSGNFTTSPNSTLTVRFRNGTWHESSRKP